MQVSSDVIISDAKVSVDDVKDNCVDEMTTGDKQKAEMPSLALAASGNLALIHVSMIQGIVGRFILTILIWPTIEGVRRPLRRPEVLRGRVRPYSVDADLSDGREQASGSLALIMREKEESQVPTPYSHCSSQYSRSKISISSSVGRALE